MMSDELREAFVGVAERQLGLPYIWGGDDPIKGWDCSGLVVECGLSVGLFPAGFDSTAAGVYALGARMGGIVGPPGKRGDLMFFSRANDYRRIHHVGILIGNGLLIEAGGGRSNTTDSTVAAQQNAYVRIRPAASRGFYTFFCDLLSVGPAQ